MATGFWTSLVHRVVSRQTSIRAGTDAPQDPRLVAADEPDGYRLAGVPQPVDRLVTVRPDTVALVLSEDEQPRVQLPGDHLVPGLRPGRPPTRVLVVNTAPVALDVTIDELETVDGFSLHATTVRVTVQLAADQYRRLLVDLASEFETDLEARLLGRVKHEVVTGAQAAVRTNRLADVRRLTLTRLLADRWLPRTLAGGALVRRDLTVTEVDWPDQPRAAEQDADAPGEDFTPRVDPDLAHLWREHAGVGPRGIAGAQVLQDCTVIAVGATEPGAYATSRLQEGFGRYFNDRHVRLISAVATSYAELVRVWFEAVGATGLESVESGRAGAEQVLSIRVATDTSPGSPADRKALRRLVPHDRIEFIAADPGD